jgi:hypothetical protein
MPNSPFSLLPLRSLSPSLPRSPPLVSFAIRVASAYLAIPPTRKAKDGRIKPTSGMKVVGYWYKPAPWANDFLAYRNFVTCGTRTYNSPAWESSG